jgi:hypothetical protein
MNISDRFAAFYTPSYVNSLKELDKLRRRIIINYFVIGTVVFAGFIFEAITWMLIGVLIIILFIFFYIRTFGVSNQYFQQQFARLTQGRIGTDLLPSSSYDPDRYIKLSVLQKACLLASVPTQFQGSNMIEHRLGDDWIQLSEIESGSMLKNDMGMTEKVIHFSGWVGIRQVETGVTEPIILMHENLVGFSGLQKTVSIQAQKDLIAWYPSEAVFNRYFSPSTLVEVVNYTEQSGNLIFISVFDGGICVAVSPVHKEKYRLANLWNKVENEKEIRKIYEANSFITQMLFRLKA